MAAILRVKRRHDNEPLNVLLVSYKRRKTDDHEETQSEAPTPATTFAKFAGTFKKQVNGVEHALETYDGLKANFKQHSINILDKTRKTAKQASADHRYKVVNCFRSLDQSAHEHHEDMTVIDVEQQSKTVDQEDSAEKDDAYVYDLYYIHGNRDIDLDHMVSVYPFEQELVFDTYRDHTCEPECESEDSNSESNWRNDYPDSSHSENSTDDDMRQAVMNMTLDDEHDSSDDDDFVYAVKQSDVEHYGFKYAKYKARMKKELGIENEDEPEDEQEELHLSDYSPIYMSAGEEDENPTIDNNLP